MATLNYLLSLFIGQKFQLRTKSFARCQTIKTTEYRSILWTTNGQTRILEVSNV
jgi:hypothetical protein